MHAMHTSFILINCLTCCLQFYTSGKGRRVCLSSLNTAIKYAAVNKTPSENVDNKTPAQPSQKTTRKRKVDSEEVGSISGSQKSGSQVRQRGPLQTPDKLPALGRHGGLAAGSVATGSDTPISTYDVEDYSFAHSDHDEGDSSQPAARCNDGTPQLARETARWPSAPTHHRHCAERGSTHGFEASGSRIPNPGRTEQAAAHMWRRPSDAAEPIGHLGDGFSSSRPPQSSHSDAHTQLPPAEAASQRMGAQQYAEQWQPQTSLPAGKGAGPSPSHAAMRPPYAAGWAQLPPQPDQQWSPTGFEQPPPYGNCWGPMLPHWPPPPRPHPHVIHPMHLHHESSAVYGHTAYGGGYGMPTPMPFTQPPKPRTSMPYEVRLRQDLAGLKAAQVVDPTSVRAEQIARLEIELRYVEES